MRSPSSRPSHLTDRRDMELLLVLLANFWAWETVRYAMEDLVPNVFRVTRFLHPFAVAVLPLLVLWPSWIPALAVAGATGLLVALVDKHMGVGQATPIQVPRRNQGGLPPLP